MSYFHRSFPKTNVIQNEGKKASSYNGPNLSIIYDYGQGDGHTPQPCSVNNTSVHPPCCSNQCHPNPCCNGGGGGGGSGGSGAKGDTGAKGDAGAPGAKGDAGPAGAKGDAGPAGAKGDAGPAGANGAKGDAGPQGPKGDSGSGGGGSSTSYYIKFFYDTNSGAPSTFTLNSTQTISNSLLPPNYSISVASNGKDILLVNSTITTNANAFLLFPTNVNFVYATGQKIADWAAAKTWTCASGIGGTKITSSSTSPPALTIQATIGAGIYGANPISGSGDGTVQNLGILYLSFKS
jgi:hypothetical protein